MKLREIAIGAAIIGGAYFLLRGGASALSSGTDFVSGFSAGIQSAIQQLTGSTPSIGGGGSGIGGGGGGGSGSGESPTKPPFPFLPIPPGTSIPTAIGIGGANIGIGAALLGGGYTLGRRVIPAIGGRLANFIKGATPVAGEVTAEELSGTVGAEFLGGGLFWQPIQPGPHTMLGKTVNIPGARTPGPIEGILHSINALSRGDILGVFRYQDATTPSHHLGPTGPIFHGGPGSRQSQPVTQVHSERYWRH